MISVLSESSSHLLFLQWDAMGRWRLQVEVYSAPKIPFGSSLAAEDYSRIIKRRKRLGSLRQSHGHRKSSSRDGFSKDCSVMGFIIIQSTLNRTIWYISQIMCYFIVFFLCPNKVIKLTIMWFQFDAVIEPQSSSKGGLRIWPGLSLKVQTNSHPHKNST